ncbi:MAG: MarR family transcriptional regulator, partial [Sneathiella sp.]|nr:MarR family transcriptional regulator [Sneathiella sp.]
MKPKGIKKNISKPIADYVPYLLAQAHRNVHLRMEKLLKREGVQVEHWRVLEVLSDREGRSMGDLAEQVLMNHPA